MKNIIRLGVNIDHVATIRNARGGAFPDPIRAAVIAEKAGADSITAHLREDRRHISDNDIAELIKNISIPLNLEIAATEEMVEIALRYQPKSVCIVPEKREERTTEGGLDLFNSTKRLRIYVDELSKKNIRVSFFVEPEMHTIDMAKDIGAPVVELHTGSYCDAKNEGKVKQHLNQIEVAAKHATSIGLECHAGHGLTFDSVPQIASISSISELNIGHFLIGESIFSGLTPAIKKMRSIMDESRKK